MNILKFTLKIKRKLLSLFFVFKDYFTRFKPKKKRIINLKSKKIIFIDHSFHQKTESSQFLINYLKEFFDVEIILDESWKGRPFPDLSFIDDNYLAVIFWQSIPDKNIIKKINHDNIIFFPMYDGFRYDYTYIREFRDLKIVNFSKTLHKKLTKWGLDSLHIQYFPEPKEFTPGNINEVFFWQRLTHINIKTIIKFFERNNIKIHIHRVVDQNEEFIQPDKGLEEKFNITYSDWFEKKNEYFDLIKEKSFYIAPRDYEGIGMSFLEAMAMGKAVIAVGNPTMNEYIRNGENGYLFDLKSIKEINLSNVRQIQRNTYKYMCNGYKKWSEDKHKIIGFIKRK